MTRRTPTPPTTRTVVVVTLLAALFGTGCRSVTTAPSVAETIEPPPSWIGAPDGDSETHGPSAEDLAVWWRQLDDPVLDRLVERAIAGNTDLEIAATRVEEARALRGLAAGELGPSISAGLTSVRSEALGDGVVAPDSVSAGLDMAWEADLFGAKRLATAASQADLEAEIENLRAARVSLVAETVLAYADLRVAEARLEVLEDSLSSREETSQLTSWREQAGLASRLEANQALSSLGQARAEQPLIEQVAAAARLRLALLTGEQPGALDDLLSGPERDIPIPQVGVSAGIPAETLNQRPDVRSAVRRLEAAWARLGAAEAARYPTVRLTGSLDAQSEDLSNLFDIDSMVASLISGITAPIFESGRIRSNIEVREAQWEQAVLGYRGTVLEALSEVERALVDHHAATNRIVALEEAVAAAAEAADLADQRYEAGLVDLLSVLDTQRTLFGLEDQLAVARGERLKAFSNLYRALGGGWGAAPDEPVAEGGTHA